MNGFKEINGEFFKEHEMVMLPTENVTTIIKCVKEQSQGRTRICVGDVLAADQFRTSEIKEYHKYQYVYFLSNEPIKEGDWSIIKNHVYQKPLQVSFINDGMVYFKNDKVIILPQPFKDCPKVIASNDPELKIKFREDEVQFPDLISLPRPSNPFLEALVREYNKGNKFDKVLIQYEDKGSEEWMGDDYNCEPFWNSIYKMKVAQDGTITIREVKPKSDIDQIIEYLVEYKYNETNPVLYGFISRFVK